MRIIRNSVLALLMCGSAWAQTFNSATQITTVPATKGGTGIDTSSATGCIKITAGVWSYSPSYCGGSTTVAFSGIIAGTNTTAAMLVGSGGSLGFTGSGTINASSWNGYTLTGSGTTGYVPTVSASGVMTLQALPAGAITSVSAANSSLTITPTTGAVTAAINNSVTPTCATTSLCFNAYGLYIGPQFLFTFSCTANGTYEAGATTSNPNTCAYVYSNGTAATATLVDSLSHTGTVNSPYTTGTLAYQYCTVALGLTTTTFTGNATSTTSQAAPSQTQSATCTYRTFVGPGSGGATTATASGTTAILGTGGSGTLASAGLGNQGSYTCTTTSSQYCYILMVGGSHTFTSGGFSFPMNTPTAVTFVNQYGVTITGQYYLYQSSGTVVNTTAVITVAS